MWRGGFEYVPTDEPEQQQASEEADVEKDDLDPGEGRPAEETAFLRVIAEEADPLPPRSLDWFASCVHSNWYVIVICVLI